MIMSDTEAPMPSGVAFLAGLSGSVGDVAQHAPVDDVAELSFQDAHRFAFGVPASTGVVVDGSGAFVAGDDADQSSRAHLESVPDLEPRRTGRSVRCRRATRRARATERHHRARRYFRCQCDTDESHPRARVPGRGVPGLSEPLQPSCSASPTMMPSGPRT